MTRRSASQSADAAARLVTRGCKSSRSSRPIGSDRSSCAPHEILKATPTQQYDGNPAPRLRHRVAGCSSIRLPMRSMAARQQVANVQQQIGVAIANLGGDPSIAHRAASLVAQSAQAALDRAQLNLSYTVISAPTDASWPRWSSCRSGHHHGVRTGVRLGLDSRMSGSVELQGGSAARMRPGQ